MQNVVIDKPYQFIPPYSGTFWVRMLWPWVRPKLRKAYGIHAVEWRGADYLLDSLKAGHGIVLAPNHPRDSDPFVVMDLGRELRTPFHAIASWHVFMQSRLQGFLVHRAGAFSIYREGMDRQALAAATEILETARRPLVIFPEGIISRANDHLNALMEGVALIARSAARKRAKANPPGKVVVHPLALRYHFTGPDIALALEPVLSTIEQRLTWRPQRNLPLQERIVKIGKALLALKEVEYLGQPQPGAVAERLQGLIDHILAPLEREWLNGQSADTTVGRVKKIRMAILPEMVKGELSEPERDRRWRQLADVYLAQALSLYRPDYIASNPTAERMLETVERFEEDLTDRVRPYPLKVIGEVGAAIEVSPDRGGDDLMDQIEGSLRTLLGIAK